MLHGGTMGDPARADGVRDLSARADGAAPPGRRAAGGRNAGIDRAEPRAAGHLGKVLSDALRRHVPAGDVPRVVSLHAGDAAG